MRLASVTLLMALLVGACGPLPPPFPPPPKLCHAPGADMHRAILATTVLGDLERSSRA